MLRLQKGYDQSHGNMKKSQVAPDQSGTLVRPMQSSNSHSGVKEEGDVSHYGTFQSPDVDTHKSLFQESVKSDALATKPPGTSTLIYVYCSHFLSAWGDRMWSFGVGLFLVHIAGDNLQLPAIYGLASGLAIFLLGALVGDWVDSTPRLKAAQLSLVVQNVLVVVCAVGVYVYLVCEASITSVPGGWSVPLYQAGIILMAVLSDLASLARVIAVERDWIVKICGNDTDMLAKMTATLRRIDQTTLIVAPIATGQVMTYAGQENGALFIGVWNLCSVAVEYYLMWKVYTTIPALAQKESIHEVKDVAPSSHRSHVVDPQSHVDDSSLVVTTTPQRNEFSKSYRCDLVGSIVTDSEILLDDSEDLREVDQSVKPGPPGCCGRVLYQFITLYQGWRTYIRYSVALSGLALACLYMTVLGFDNITVAYAVTQGVSESILGVLMGVSAIFGMLGTFLYPILKRRIGLVRTGMLALSSQVTCLLLCVVSVWAPGSPFDPSYTSIPATHLTNATATPDTLHNVTAELLKTTGSLTNRMSTTTANIASLSPAQMTSFIKTNPSISPFPSASTSVNRAFIITETASTLLKTDFQLMSSFAKPLVTPSETADVTVTSFSNNPATNPSASVSFTRLFKTSPTSKEIEKNISATSSRTFTSQSPEHQTSKPLPASDFTSLSPNEQTSETPLTAAFTSLSPGEQTSETPGADTEDPTSFTSVILLMAGIVLARFGLWVADLAITQMFLEEVLERERGVVNGVQSSINKLMDVLKFGLVVAVPETQYFGFLIIISFSFICLGWLLYAIFLRRIRKHFFHRMC